MINLRVARPTDDLETISRMYRDGLSKIPTVTGSSFRTTNRLLETGRLFDNAMSA